MQKPTDIGKNRTGIATSPIDSRKLAEQPQPHTKMAPGRGGQALADERAMWSGAADPVGTMPPPVSLKGVTKAAKNMVKGNHPNVFLDKLGERLAFERTGTRLYEALLAKFDAAHPHEGGPTREELVRIRDDELRHYGIVRDAIVALGADPTAVTPCADIAGVLSMGLVQVLSDPRTTLTQALDAILTAELTDNDAWILLVDLAQELGQDEMASQFRVALVEEEDHLERVRAWIAASLRGQAGIAPTPPQPEARA